MSSAETDVEGSSSPEYNSSSDVQPSDSDGDSKAVADPEVNQTDLLTTPPYSLTPVTDGSQKKNEYNLACKLTESAIREAQNLGRTGSWGSNLQNYTLGNSSRSAMNPADCRMPMTSNFSSPVPYPQIPLTHRWPIPMTAQWDYPGFYDNLALHNNVAAENVAVAGYSGSGLPYYPQRNSPVNVLPQPVSYGDYSGGQAASGPAGNSADSGIQPRHILTIPHHLTQMPGSQNQMIGGQPNRILSESNMLPTQNLGHTGSLASSHSNSTQGHSSKAALIQPKKRRTAGLGNRIWRRTLYTTSQLLILEKAFQENSHPSIIEKEQIAEKIGVEKIHVQKWFYNRRHRGMRNKSNPSEGMKP